MTKIGADDLDDGLDYSFDVHSDNEDPTEFLEPLSDGEPEVGRLEKRKHREDEEEIDEIHPERKQLNTKKSKKGNTEKLKDRKKQKVSTIVDQKSNLATMSPSLIADYIANKIKRRNPNLSTIELNELYLQESQFKDTSSFTKKRDLENLPQFINKYFSSTLKPEVKEKLVIILSVSALRVCDVTRGLKSIPGGAIKLIKKNQIKYDETALKLKKSAVVVSTSGRLNRLINDKIFDVSRVSSIIVESTYLDSKTNNVWDLEDTVSTLKTLTTSNNAKIYLY